MRIYYTYWGIIALFAHVYYWLFYFEQADSLGYIFSNSGMINLKTAQNDNDVKVFAC